MPYDAVEDEGGEFIQLPGRTVAEAMADILANLGCAVKAVESAGDHGWIFQFKFKSAAASCEVTAIDGVVAQFVGPDGQRGKSGTPNPDYVEILDRFAAAMHLDPRFRDLGWFSAEELTSEQAGARTPTGPYDPTHCERSFGQDRGGESRGGLHDTLLSGGAHPGGAARVAEWTPAGPLRRFAARMFDHFVVVGGALLLAVSYLRIPSSTLRALTFNFNLYVLIFSLAVGGGLLNAVFVRTLSTTLGKWLSRVRVVREEGRPLSYGAALKREAEAIVAGCAMFLPMVMYAAFAVGFWRLIASGETAWDRRNGAIVLQAPPSFRTRAATVICLVSTCVVGFMSMLIWVPQKTVA